MKKIFSLILFISITFHLLAAPAGIRGTVVDAKSQTPLDYVNVALFKKGSDKMIKGATTDKNGNFSFAAINEGLYELRISFVGYNTFKQDITLKGAPVNLGKLILKENSKALKEVEVVGQGSTMKLEVDKKVFSVDQNIASAGGSASDVLQNIPSVTVDNEGNVALRNSSDVEVWINGKPSGLTAENRGQILQQMPAESIESVEIMTNPSAKFKPEGSSGIINLVLKKNRKAGYYGSISAGGMYNTTAEKLGGTLGANFSYSSQKLEANVNVGFRRMNMPSGSWSSRDTYQSNGDVHNLYQTSENIRSIKGLFSRVSLDYHLTDKNTLSFSGMGMRGRSTTDGTIDYTLYNVTADTLIRKYQRNTDGTGSRNHIHTNLGFRHEFDKKGSMLDISVGYSNHDMSQDSRYIQSNNQGKDITSDLSQAGGGSENEYELKIDYTKKFSENSKLEAGMESNYSHQQSNTSGVNHFTEKPIDSYFNNFDYEEQIHAAYLTYGGKIDKFTYQAGLRGEYYSKWFTNTARENGVNIPQEVSPIDYWQAYPSLFIGYSLPHNNEIQLNVTRRVDRPRGMQLNPYHNYSDSTNVTYGNPKLDPQFSLAYELNYIKTWDAHTLSGSLYYRATNNVIQDISFLKDGIMQSTSMNLAKQANVGLELVAKNRLFQVLNLTTSVNLYNSHLDSAVYTENNVVLAHTKQQDLFSWNARTMANFALSKTTFGQITAEYNAPRLIAQGKENANFAVDLGLRQTFFDKKLSLNLMVRDVFYSRKRKTTTWGTGYNQNGYTYWGGRMIGLTASYNFGNMKPKKQERSGQQEMNSMDNGMD
ncbi:MAG: hypothetical protein RIS29_79 [Bacteroidota bacterium]|jgi:hypothetical protein